MTTRQTRSTLSATTGADDRRSDAPLQQALVPRLGIAAMMNALGATARVAAIAPDAIPVVTRLEAGDHPVGAFELAPLGAGVAAHQVVVVAFLSRLQGAIVPRPGQTTESRVLGMKATDSREPPRDDADTITFVSTP